MVGGGWFKVYRRLLSPEHPFAKGEPVCSKLAWLDLIGLAAWSPDDGLEPGQFAASERSLAARWHWPKTRVRRFLRHLRKERMIQRLEKAASGQVYAITKWAHYQATAPRLDHPKPLHRNELLETLDHPLDHPNPLGRKDLPETLDH